VLITHQKQKLLQHSFPIKLSQIY